MQNSVDDRKEIEQPPFAERRDNRQSTFPRAEPVLVDVGMRRVGAGGGGLGIERRDVIPDARELIEIQANGEPTEIDSLQCDRVGRNAQRPVFVLQRAELPFDRRQFLPEKPERRYLRRPLGAELTTEIVDSAEELLEFSGQRLTPSAGRRLPAALFGPCDVA